MRLRFALKIIVPLYEHIILGNLSSSPLAELDVENLEEVQSPGSIGEIISSVTLDLDIEQVFKHVPEKAYIFRFVSGDCGGMQYLQVANP